MNVAYPNPGALARNDHDASADEAFLSRSSPAPRIAAREPSVRWGISVFACDYRPGETISTHRHDVAQLIYAPTGMMSVVTSAGEWTISPREAVWIPSQTEHRIRMLGPVRLRSLYIDSGSSAAHPDAPAIVPVSALLRAVILRLIIAGDDHDTGTSLEQLCSILFDELAALTSAGASVPLPREGRLRALCSAFLDDPGSTCSIDDWAKRFGMTRKALTRSFRREMNMTFGMWQRGARVQEASKRLAAGQSVTRVALDLGYESLSAFTAMFHRATGFPPSKLLARNQP